MVNILINGAKGRMGKKVFEATQNIENAKAVCGVDLNEDLSNADFPIYGNFADVKEKVDVLIDFSAPASLPAVLKFITENKINAVLCATGYKAEDIESIKKASEKVAIFRSANMSLGVNVIIDLVKKATQTLEGFDIEIVEKHHNNKADAPSGTALMLADAVKAVKPEKFYVYGREGQVGKRNKDEIGIHAVRGGNIVGEHDVLFAAGNEVITISHQAFDRSVFADGAVNAAKYIKDKKPGIYDMSDLICGR